VYHTGEEEREEGVSHSDAGALSSIRAFEEAVAITRRSPVSQSYKEELAERLKGIVEGTQDFTDSAYVGDEHRRVSVASNEIASLKPLSTAGETSSTRVRTPPRASPVG